MMRDNAHTPTVTVDFSYNLFSYSLLEGEARKNDYETLVFREMEIFLSNRLSRSEIRALLPVVGSAFIENWGTDRAIDTFLRMHPQPELDISFGHQKKEGQNRPVHSLGMRRRHYDQNQNLRSTYTWVMTDGEDNELEYIQIEREDKNRSVVFIYPERAPEFAGEDEYVTRKEWREFAARILGTAVGWIDENKPIPSDPELFQIIRRHVVFGTWPDEIMDRLKNS